MDSERALAVAEESFLVNLLSDETQEIIRHDMREYEIENGCRFERDETGKYLWMQRPFSELKKVLYSGIDLIYCEPEEVKELYKKSRTYSIPIELSKADLRSLCCKAGSVGLTVGELLENFINDLIIGERSNGSDERMYAEQWFQRCWFSIDYGTSSFLSYLYNMTMIDYVEGLLEELEHYDSAHKLEDYENLERQEIQNELEGIFNDYKEECKNESCSFKEEIEEIKKWINEREGLTKHAGIYSEHKKSH